MSFETKVAMITGVNDPRGIGYASAWTLAANGARIVIGAHEANPREAAMLRAAIDDFEAAFPGTVLGLALDVRDEAAFARAVGHAIERFGRLDVLVNNAGSGAGTGPFLATTAAEWQAAWDVNVMGCVHGCRAALPAMLRQGGGGNIINMASISGIGANALYGAYAATKHAVVGLTRTLAAEYAPHNVRVNALCPGIVDTAMNDAQIEMLAAARATSQEKVRTAMLGLPAMRRFATPAEIAASVLFLASDAASYITGVTLPVAGGLHRGL